MKSVFGDVTPPVGMYMRDFEVHKFGRNPDADSGVDEFVWPRGGATYPWPTIAQQLEIVSTSVDDTGPAGNGARDVAVFGLDANYDPIEELVRLNGTTPVTSSKSYIRVNRMLNPTSKPNVGEITAAHGLDVLAVILPGRNQTEQCIVTVPRGRTFLLTSALYAASANREIGYALWAQNFPGVARIQQQWGGYASSQQVIYDPVLGFSQGTDIYVTANPGTNNEEAIAELFGYNVPITGTTSVEKYIDILR